MSRGSLLTRAYRAARALAADVGRLPAARDVRPGEPALADSNPDGAFLSEATTGDPATTPEQRADPSRRKKKKRGLPVTTAEGHIDMCDREPCSSVLRIGGWALVPDALVSRVDVLLDGRSVGSARLGLPRKDLARPSPRLRLRYAASSSYST